MFAIGFQFSRQALGKLSFIGAAIPTRGATAGVVQRAIVFALFCLSGLCWLPPASLLSVRAQDWPQMMGPDRSGQAIGQEPLGTTWPPTPNIVWQANIGSGYGGPAVVGQQVFVLHRLGQKEMLECFDLVSGESQWQAAWQASYRSSIDPDNGPRCAPTVIPAPNSDKIPIAVCYGAAGDLSAVDTRDGKLLWHRPLRTEYQAEDGYFGAGSSPLVVGERVVVCLGGKAAGIVGLDLVSGKTLWTATDYEASYAAPIAIDTQTVLVVMRLKTVLVDLESGRVLSEVPFGSRGPTVNAATPISVGAGRYLLTASYGVGATLLNTTGRKLEPLLAGSELLNSQYNTPVLAADRVIGIDGREDVGIAGLRSIDFDLQKVYWTHANVGTAHLIAIGTQVLTLNVAGRLALVDASADSYVELANLQLPTGIYRAPPALSQGKLIVRDTSREPGKSKLLCIAL